MKTTVRYHLRPVGMAVVKKPNFASVGEDAEGREPRARLAGLHLGAATMENGVDTPQKLKNRATL